MKMTGNFWNSTTKNMQKSEYIMICKAPQRYGGLEVIAPIVSEIKKLIEVKAYLYFHKNSKCFVQFKKDKYLKRIVEKIFAKNINFFLFFKFTIIKHLLLNPKKKLIVFLPYEKTGTFEKLLSKKIDFINYPKTTSLKNLSIKSKITCLKMVGEKNNIGIPKFYASWMDNLKTKRRKKNLLIILPSVVENIFNQKDFENWLEDIFIVIKNSKSPVIVKPHPMQKKKEILILKKKALEFKISNMIVSYNHSSILFQNAKLVISLHSSLLLDSLYFKVPTIFFQSFTPLWLKVHKDKSCYLNLGAKYAKNRSELKKIFLSKEIKCKLKLKNNNNLIKVLIQNKIL